MGEEIPPDELSLLPGSETMDQPALVEALRSALLALKDDAPRKKDRWDKAGIVCQFLSGFLIAALGIVVTILVHRQDARQKATELEMNERQISAQQQLVRQQNIAQLALSEKETGEQLAISQDHDKAELDLENRKNFSAYLDRLSDAGKSDRRAVLLGQMEATLTPDQALRIALEYLHPPFGLEEKSAYENDRIVYNTALSVAEHLRDDTQDQLKKLSMSSTMPDREIARGILGEKTRILIRASEIDDFADLTLDGTPIIPKLTFGQDSGWIDITDRLRRSKIIPKGSELKFLVTNGPAGGYGGRLQVSAGVQQYDTGPYAKNECPCDKPAFAVTVRLKVLPNGQAQLLGSDLVTFAP